MQNNKPEKTVEEIEEEDNNELTKLTINGSPLSKFKISMIKKHRIYDDEVIKELFNLNKACRELKSKQKVFPLMEEIIKIEMIEFRMEYLLMKYSQKSYKYILLRKKFEKFKEFDQPIKK